MKISSTGVLLALLALVGCGGQGGPSTSTECTATASSTTASIHAEAMSERYSRFIVELDEGRVVALSNILNSEKFRVNVERLSRGFQVVSLAKGDRLAMLEALASLKGVKRIEPDFEVSVPMNLEEAAPAPDQWAHMKVASSDAWKISNGSERVIVAVIDGGVDIGHPDLAENIYRNPTEIMNGRDDDGNGYVDDVSGWDFITNDSNPRSDSSKHYHGTHVAGIIGALAHRARMQIGHAPRVRILPLKFINSQGSGATSDAIRAIDYAIAMGAHIINASWSSTNYSSALYAAMVRAERAGVLFVAAAGNAGHNNDQTPHYPANYALANVISVAASNSSDALASFSDYGASTVDLAAPGTSIYSTKNDGGYATMSGTSMATPLVTGVAVLVKSRHLEFSGAQIAQSIFMGVDKVSALKGKVRFAGRINALKALTASDQVAAGMGVPVDNSTAGLCSN